jgi:hypothetical protein
LRFWVDDFPKKRNTKTLGVNGWNLNWFLIFMCYTQVSDMQKFITIYFFLLLANVSFGQNICDSLKEYKKSQEWVNELKGQPADIRKGHIIERMKCEQSSQKDSIKFWLTVIIDGYITEVPAERLKELDLISADNFKIASSLCESEGIYPQKCNLGFVIIDTQNQPILNENDILKQFSIKQNKRTVTLTFFSEKAGEVHTKVSSFSKPDVFKKEDSLKIKKGKNRISFNRDRSLKVIELVIHGKRTMILQ